MSAGEGAGAGGGGGGDRALWHKNSVSVNVLSLVVMPVTNVIKPSHHIKVQAPDDDQLYSDSLFLFFKNEV